MRFYRLVFPNGCRFNRYRFVRLFGYAISLQRVYHPPENTVWDRHQWDQLSLCLWGSSTETTLEDGKVRTIKIRPGTIRYRKAEDWHNFVNGGMLTLVFTWPTRRRGEIKLDGMSSPSIDSRHYIVNGES